MAKLFQFLSLIRSRKALPSVIGCGKRLMEWLDGGSNLKSHRVSMCGMFNTLQVDWTWALVSIDCGPNTAATSLWSRVHTGVITLANRYSTKKARKRAIFIPLFDAWKLSQRSSFSITGSIRVLGRMVSSEFMRSIASRNAISTASSPFSKRPPTGKRHFRTN